MRPSRAPLVIQAVAVITFASSETLANLPDSTLAITEVVYSQETQYLFVGTPSITRLQNGTLLASYNYFSGGPSPECKPGPEEARSNVSVWAVADEISALATVRGYPSDTTYVVASHDDGQSWSSGPVTTIHPIHFTTIQQLPALTSTSSGVAAGPPLAAVGTTPGGIRVALSYDGGMQWQSQLVVNGTFDSGATPIVVHGGYMYRAVEAKVGKGGWPVEYQAVMLRGRIEGGSYDSLLTPSNWVATPPLQFQYPAWIPPAWRQVEWSKPGYLEGNAVVGPDGVTMYNFLRVNSLPYANKGILLKYTPPASDTDASASASGGGALSFDRAVEFPGGMSKFSIRRLEGLAPGGGPLYVVLSNNVTDVDCPSMRDVLTVSTSTDLVQWEVHGVVLHDDTGLSQQDAHRYAGFHYVDVVAEVVGSQQPDASAMKGPVSEGHQLRGGGSVRTSVVELSFVVRTAYRGAVSYHNSNRMTFKKVRLEVTTDDVESIVKVNFSNVRCPVLGNGRNSKFLC